jgi:hypothetical protein
MADPTVTVALNKSTFAPGEQMRLTATYSDPDSASGTVTVIVTDSEGHTSAPATVGYAIAESLTVTVDDSGSHTFTKVSDDGHVAVYTATA